MLLRSGDRSDTGDADTAVLDRTQWQTVVAALQSSPGAHPEALDTLTACAPPGWLPYISGVERERAASVRELDAAERDGIPNDSEVSE